MTTGSLTDERFPLSSPRGFVPTTETVSDTPVTPFGLTLRTAPDPRNVAVVRSANGGGLVMATQKATTISDDGQDPDDIRADVVDD